MILNKLKGPFMIFYAIVTFALSESHNLKPSNDSIQTE